LNPSLADLGQILRELETEANINIVLPQTHLSQSLPFLTDQHTQLWTLGQQSRPLHSEDPTTAFCLNSSSTQHLQLIAANSLTSHLTIASTSA
jgi:hypothetical protein